MKVVCINDSLNMNRRISKFTFPNGFIKKGEIYTILSTKEIRGYKGYVLKEKPTIARNGQDMGFRADRFVSLEYYHKEFKIWEIQWDVLVK